MFTKKEFELLIRQLLSIEDFKLVQEIGGYELLKKESDRLLRITLGYRKYPGVFYFRIPIASISIIKIEDIIHNYYIKHKITDPTGPTIYSRFHPLSGIDYAKFELPIEHTNSFEIVANEIKKIFNNGIIPFFKSYQTLEDIAELLGPLKLDEIIPYIQGSVSLPKTALILRETNHPSYLQRLFEFHLILKDYAKNERYQPLLKLYEDLFYEDLQKH